MVGRVSVIGLVLVLSGCAGPPAVQPRWQSCAAAGASVDAQDALKLHRLAGDFPAVTAVICVSRPERRAGGGSDLVAVQERADDVAALVAALRLPDAEPTHGACTFELPAVPWLALLDAGGRWVRPGVPVDSCGKPRREFRTAFGQLRTTTVSTRVLRPITSDEAAAAGCEQRWADMAWMAGVAARSGGGAPGTANTLPANDAEVRVCVYRVPVSERGADKPAGEFESGRPLPAWPAVRRALATAGPAAACATPATRFAVLRPPVGEIYVEGDGCRRLLPDGGSLQQAPPALLPLLFDS
jgi:hypothetical protein